MKTIFSLLFCSSLFAAQPLPPADLRLLDLNDMLCFHVGTNTVAQTNGLDLSNIHSCLEHFSKYATQWNENFWLRKVRNHAAVAACVYSNCGAAFSYAPCLISPRHALICAHMIGAGGPYNTNNYGLWLGTNNVRYYSRFVDSAVVAGDLAIAILETELPTNEVGFCRVFDSNLTALVGKTFSFNLVDTTHDDNYDNAHSFSTASDKWYPATTFGFAKHTANPSFGLTTNWSLRTCNGDSGSPVRCVYENELVLLGAHTIGDVTYSGFPLVSAYISQINSNMTHLTEKHGFSPNYQLSVIDLSKYAKLP